MAMIRVREKNQITLPKDVMAFLHAKPDSYIEYFIRGNGVFMRPAQITHRRESIFRYAGVGKKRTYATAKEADAFISSQRDEWDR